MQFLRSYSLGMPRMGLVALGKLPCTFLVVCSSPPSRTLRAFLCPHLWSLGLIGELQQTRPLHDVGEEHELGLISTEDLAHQYEA